MFFFFQHVALLSLTWQHWLSSQHYPPLQATKISISVCYFCYVINSLLMHIVKQLCVILKQVFCTLLKIVILLKPFEESRNRKGTYVEYTYIDVCLICVCLCTVYWLVCCFIKFFLFFSSFLFEWIRTQFGLKSTCSSSLGFVTQRWQ